MVYTSGEDDGYVTIEKYNDLDVSHKELEQQLKSQDLKQKETELLSKKRYEALNNLTLRFDELKNINKTLEKDLDTLNGSIHKKRQEELKPHQKELDDALNNRIYSDTDWKDYLNKIDPTIFEKLLNDNHFFDKDTSGVKHYQDVETEQENHKKIRELYTKSYINLKKSGLINGWDYKRTEISRSWKNELKYMYTVNNYFMHELKKKEGMWSWILIVISSIVSVVSILDLTDLLTVIILQYTVTIFSVVTSLVAAYIKKENYVERIKELDRYIQKVGKIVTSIEYVINQKPWNRQEYQNFKERFQNEVNALLSTPPPMSPSELKNTVYDLTKTHSENLKQTYPWFKLKMYKTMPYYSMTEYGRDILESHWSDNWCRKIGIYLCCTSKLEIRARYYKKDAIEWFHDKNRDINLEKGYYWNKRFSPPIGLTNRYKVNWNTMRYLKAPGKCIAPGRSDNCCFFFISLFILIIIYTFWIPFIILYFIFECIRMFFMPCFVPEYNQFLYPENYNLMIERKMKFKWIKEKDYLLGNLDERKIMENQTRRNIQNDNIWGGNNVQISRLKTQLKKEKAMNDMRERLYLDIVQEVNMLKSKGKDKNKTDKIPIDLEVAESQRKAEVHKELKEYKKLKYPKSRKRNKKIRKKRNTIYDASGNKKIYDVSGNIKNDIENGNEKNDIESGIVEKVSEEEDQKSDEESEL